MISTKATTRLSSKGQVVIPESIRETLRLKTGDVFLVYGKDDTIVFKAAPPVDDEFETIVSDFENFAKEAHLKPLDIKNAVKKVRAHR